MCVYLTLPLFSCNEVQFIYSAACEVWLVCFLSITLRYYLNTITTEAFGQQTSCFFYALHTPAILSIRITMCIQFYSVMHSQPKSGCLTLKALHLRQKCENFLKVNQQHSHNASTPLYILYITNWKRQCYLRFFVKPSTASKDRQSGKNFKIPFLVQVLYTYTFGLSHLVKNW